MKRSFSSMNILKIIGTISLSLVSSYFKLFVTRYFQKDTLLLCIHTYIQQTLKYNHNSIRQQ